MTFPFSLSDVYVFSPLLRLSLHLFLSVLPQVKCLFSAETKDVSVQRLTSVTVMSKFYFT